MVSEERIYLWTKRKFRDEGWTPLGGDPPRGTDLPRIEIKEPEVTHSLRKNANSIINDLVFCREGKIALIECKDDVRKTDYDVEKLKTLCNNRAWRISLVQALEERSQFQRQGGCLDKQDIISGDSIVPVLSFPGTPRTDLENFVQLAFDENREVKVEIGNRIDIVDL
jgi:hypothetical protein